MALARLSFHEDREDFRDAATQAVRATVNRSVAYPGVRQDDHGRGVPVERPLELAISDRQATKGTTGCSMRWHATSFPSHHRSRQPDALESQHPLLKGKGLVDGQAALYVCSRLCLSGAHHQSERRGAGIDRHSRQDSPPRTLASQGIPGTATVQGTAAYVSGSLARSPGLTAHGYTTLGATGLTNSRIGFGGYRTGLDHENHRTALMKAIREGCNSSIPPRTMRTATANAWWEACSKS